MKARLVREVININSNGGKRGYTGKIDNRGKAGRHQ